jgi:fucose permease
VQDNARAVAALIVSYAILGLLMNSVGTVILQSISQYGISKPHAATLEACKDLSVVAASFLVAMSLSKFGFRRAQMTVMAVIALGALLMPFSSKFWMNQAMFVVVGLCFGIAKVATYSSVGLLRPDPKGHASLTSLIEGIFMLGVLAGIWMFGWFIAGNNSGNEWLRVYYVIAALAAMSVILWMGVELNEQYAAPSSENVPASRLEMLRLVALPTTTAFLISIFLYVLIEQGVGTWLPTFNNEVLKLPSSISVQMSGIFIGAIALGRLGASGLVVRLGWLRLLLICIGAIASLVLLTLPMTENISGGAAKSWMDAPVAAFMLPLIGVFMAPIYPIVCSVMLSALPQERHPTMVGLMVIFSALGGTIGSFITGFAFQHLSGQTAFYLILGPLALLAVMLIRFHRKTLLDKQTRTFSVA